MTDAELERLRDKNGVAMPRVISGVAAAAASAVVIGVGVNAVIRSLADIVNMFAPDDKLYSVLSQTGSAEITLPAGILLVCCLMIALFVMKYRSEKRTVLKTVLWTLLFLVLAFVLVLLCTRVNSVPFGRVASILAGLSGSLGELL